MGKYYAPIDISPSLWLEILQNTALTFKEELDIFFMLKLVFSDDRATATQLATVLNVEKYQNLSWHIIHFGERIVEEYPHIDYPKAEENKSGISFWNIPFVGENIESGHNKGSFYWQLRPELSQALDELKSTLSIKEIAQVCERRDKAHFSIADLDNLIEEDNLYEGAITTVTTNVYKRNPFAREKCIEHYGTKCVICDFDFGKTYGEEFEGKIHVHHIKPLHEIGELVEVDPVNDLVPVCPNCHFIIHSKKSLFSIDDIKKMINR